MHKRFRLNMKIIKNLYICTFIKRVVKSLIPEDCLSFKLSLFGLHHRDIISIDVIKDGDVVTISFYPYPATVAFYLDVIKRNKHFTN